MTTFSFMRSDTSTIYREPSTTKGAEDELVGPGALAMHNQTGQVSRADGTHLDPAAPLDVVSDRPHCGHGRRGGGQHGSI
jgi:hypothetical protein